MGSAIDKPLRGLAVLDPAWGPGGIDAAASDYTEADPRPGSSSTTDALARGEPQIVGAQPRPVTLIGTRSAGLPGGPPNGAGLAYYFPDEGETIDDARHHRPAFQIVDARNFGADVGRGSIVTSGLTGKVLAAPHIDDVDVGISGVGNDLWTWDPQTETWASTAESPSGSGVLCALPGTDRVLWIDPRGSSFYSDDFGANWTKLSDFAPLVPADGTYEYTGGPGSAVVDRNGQIAVLFKRDSSETTADLFTSIDGGLTFEAAGSLNDVGQVSMCAHPSGVILIAYTTTDGTPDELRVARLSGASTDPSGAPDVLVDDSARLKYDPVIVCEEDGTLWLYYAAYVTTTPAYCLWSASFDAGLTWEAPGSETDRMLLSWHVVQGSRAEAPRPQAATSAGGRVFLLVGAADGAAISSGVLELGGWQNRMLELVESKTAASGVARNPIYRYPNADGAVGSSTARSVMWLPLAEGSDFTAAGYTRVNSAGGWTESLADGGHEMVATAASGRVYYSDSLTAGSSDGDVFARYAVKVVDSTGDDIRFKVSSRTREFSIVHTETSFYVVDDLTGLQVGSAVTTTSGAIVRIELYLDDAAASLRILYREGPGPFWNTILRSTSIKAPSASTTIQWGITETIGLWPVTCVWYYVIALARRGGSVSLPTPQLLEGRDGWGRPIPSLYGVTIPELFDTTTQRYARLTLRGGPVARHETYTHDVAPDYPIENLFPTVASSPDDRWRSVDKSQNQILRVDVSSYDSRLAGSPAIVVYVAGANFRRLRVRPIDASGSVLATGTMDLATGFESVGYTLDGRVMTWATGSAGSRYLWPGELRGGHVILDGGKVRRIEYNTGGRWADDDAAARIFLEGVDGTETASGDAAIVWPAGVATFNLPANMAAIEFRILSTESAPEDYYEAGIIAPFGLRPTGKQWSDGWEWDRAPNVSISADSRGTERRAQIGPNRRRLTYSWDDGFLLERVRSNASPDYVASSTGAFLAARDEVWQELCEIQNLTEGYARPVLWCGKVPDGGETLTDPTLYLYGYLQPQGLRVRQTAGDEGADEYLRASGVEIVEAV